MRPCQSCYVEQVIYARLVNKGTYIRWRKQSVINSRIYADHSDHGAEEHSGHAHHVTLAVLSLVRNFPRYTSNYNFPFLRLIWTRLRAEACWLHTAANQRLHGHWNLQFHRLEMQSIFYTYEFAINNQEIWKLKISEQENWIFRPYFNFPMCRRSCWGYQWQSAKLSTDTTSTG